MRKKIAAVMFAAWIFFPLIARAGDAKPPEIDVLLWFDTEDYLLPADDDAAKRLAEMLTQRGIRATFKVVGEKARVLVRRGRTDVIEALKKHNIGYHSNFHSVHPTPSEYLADCGLLDGIAEFERREGGGAADVRRIFGVETLACYGQPGSSWGSQAIWALKSIGVAPHGIPCYVDEGSHVGLDEKPFWYCGAINVFHMGQNHTRMELFDPAAVEPAKQKISEIAERLAKDGGGLISIYYHPCEWVHREFWDGVNFKRGANPPPALWKPPAQRSEEETNAAFDRFGQYLDYILKIPGVKFVTASELPVLYPDEVRSKDAPVADLDAIAARILDEKSASVDFIVVNGRAYSVADQFEVLLAGIRDHRATANEGFVGKPTGLLGPDGAPPGHSTRVALSVDEVAPALRDAADYISTQHRIPSRIFIGASAIPPEDFLVTLASLFAYQRKYKYAGHVEDFALRPMELLPAKRVAEDTVKVFGGWIIHKEGFRAPKILDVARLQTWTLKPAIRAK